MSTMHYDVVECTFEKAHITLVELRQFVENTKAFDGSTVVNGEWKEPKVGSVFHPSRIHVRRALFGAGTIEDPFADG